MTINQVQCDGCGKVVDKDTESEHYPPKGWSRLFIANSGIDLCPDCTKKVEEFIQGLKV